MAIAKERYAPVLDEYLKDFELLQRELVGMRILDAGAGLRQFARDCTEQEAAEVWSVAKDTDDWLVTKQRMDQTERMQPDSEWLAIWKKVEAKSQCGLFQNLPYAGGSFDLVLSHNALTQSTESEEEMTDGMMEMVWVLRSGGEIRLFPGWTDCWPAKQRLVVMGALSRLMEVAGVRVEIKRTEIKIGGMVSVGSMVILHKD